MQAREKFTLFIVDSNGKCKGVKSRNSFTEVFWFVQHEYQDAASRGKAFIVRVRGEVVWRSSKR